MFTNTRRHIQMCVSFVDTFIYHDFRNINIFHPLFGLQSQIMTFKKSTRNSQSCNFGKILQCWKNLGMSPSSRFLVWIFLPQKVRQWIPPCVLQGGSHCLTFWQKNIRSKNLNDGNNNIFLYQGLAVWRLSRNQFKPV